ncbi:MAG TPA: hypothetical protein VIK11_04910 [Tepidiformaceae bacterium]
MSRFAIGLLIVSLLLLGACRSRTDSTGATSAATQPMATSAPPTVQPAQVPAEYSQLYQSLSQGLDAWQQSLQQRSATGATAPIFGAHLLVANANRGTALLEPSTMTAVDSSLDRLKQLGVQGVTITISFPLFNADQPQAADYLSFYATVARHVRDRGLKLSVEQHVAFSGTPFSSVQFDYTKLPFDQFVALDHRMSQLILDNIQPDFLTLLSEPDTFGSLTGYKQVSTPDGAAAMVGAVLAGLNRGQTKIGAGAGSWLQNAPQYAAAFARTSIDYIDLHIYPITPATIQVSQAVADAAKSAGKPVVLDEAWLYKVTGIGGVDQEALQELRDPFSFWAPLDSRYLALLAQFARANNVAYVAPFWSTFFWAYVDYGPNTKDLQLAPLQQMTNQAVSQALRDGTFTDTGKAYSSAISGR